jgi:hypothetical protein
MIVRKFIAAMKIIYKKFIKTQENTRTNMIFKNDRHILMRVLRFWRKRATVMAKESNLLRYIIPLSRKI